MSNTTDANQVVSDSEDTETNSNWRRDLEKKIEKAEERAVAAETALATKARNEALSSAGLDLSTDKDGNPTNPLHKFFADKYDGDVSSDAITQAATQYGIFTSTQADPSTLQTANQHARLDTASYGAEANVEYGSQEEVLTALKNAKSSQEADAILKAHGMMR